MNHFCVCVEGRGIIGVWITGAVSSSVVLKACRSTSEEHLGVVSDKYSTRLEESYSMPNTVQMLWSSYQHPFTDNSGRIEVVQCMKRTKL